MLLRGRSGNTRSRHAWWTADRWTVEAALVPKPGKLRLPIESQFSLLFWMQCMISSELFGDALLHYEMHVTTGVDFKRSLIDYDIRREDLRAFVTELALPRHVGVLRVSSEELHLCDFLLDVTEVQRNRDVPSVLGIAAPGVPWLSESHSRLVSAAKFFGCPMITGP